ncbi:MAG: hypothetical protein ACOCXH_13120 [Cyclobacteriaceae bacterium]
MRKFFILFALVGCFALAQEPDKPDTTDFEVRHYDARIIRYLPAPPDSLNSNPYTRLVGDSIK